MWRFPYIVLVILNLLDFWATSQIIEDHGFEVEANPLLFNWMISVGNTSPILLAKLVPVVVLGILLVCFRHQLLHREKLIKYAMWGLNIGLVYANVLGILILYQIHIL